jgi:hypothetical protein
MPGVGSEYQVFVATPLGAALLDFTGKWNYCSEKDLSTNLVTIDSTFFFTHDLIRKYSLPLAW